MQVMPRSTFPLRRPSFPCLHGADRCKFPFVGASQRLFVSKKLPDGEIVPKRTFELGAFPTSGHLLSDLTNSLCAYVPGRTFDTSRFKTSYAAVNLVSIADQSASTIAPLRASRNAIASALSTPASRSSTLSSPYRRLETRAIIAP
jgi:hypothetical protein